MTLNTLRLMHPDYGPASEKTIRLVVCCNCPALSIALPEQGGLGWRENLRYLEENSMKSDAALTLDDAHQIIHAALAHSKKSGFAPMGIAVLDSAGHLKAFASED